MDWVCLESTVSTGIVESIYYSYVEWEKYPDKKKRAEEILKAAKFTPIPGASLCL